MKDSLLLRPDAAEAKMGKRRVEADGWTEHTSFAKALLFSVQPGRGTERKAASMGA
jgi:hypothetical protein